MNSDPCFVKYTIPEILDNDWKILERIISKNIDIEQRKRISEAVNRYVNNITSHARGARSSEIRPLYNKLKTRCANLQQTLGDILALPLTDEAFCEWIRDHEAENQEAFLRIFNIHSNKRKTIGLNHFQSARGNHIKEEYLKNRYANEQLVQKLRKSNEVLYERAIDHLERSCSGSINRAKCYELYKRLAAFKVSVSAALDALPRDNGGSDDADHFIY